MKYRIIKDSEGEYIVQWKYKLRPFWIDNYGITEFGDFPIYDKTFAAAQKTLDSIIRQHNYKANVKVCKEIGFN